MKVDIMGVVFSCIMSALVGVLIGGHLRRIDFQHEAVRAGAAQWLTDPETGEATFSYIDSRAKEPE